MPTVISIVYLCSLQYICRFLDAPRCLVLKCIPLCGVDNWNYTQAKPMSPECISLCFFLINKDSIHKINVIFLLLRDAINKLVLRIIHHCCKCPLHPPPPPLCHLQVCGANRLQQLQTADLSLLSGHSGGL